MYINIYIYICCRRRRRGKFLSSSSAVNYTQKESSLTMKDKLINDGSKPIWGNLRKRLRHEIESNTSLAITSYLLSSLKRLPQDYFSDISEVWFLFLHSLLQTLKSLTQQMVCPAVKLLGNNKFVYLDKTKYMYSILSSLVSSLIFTLQFCGIFTEKTHWAG